MRLLDANEFITAKNSYYGTDFAPGFWQWISQDYIANDLRAIGAVREELIAQEDELAAWSRELPADFWLEETDADVPSLRSLAAWTMSGDSRFVQQARTDFLATADYRLVAQAHAGGHVVVTRSRSTGGEEADQDPRCLRCVWCGSARAVRDIP